MAEAGTHTPGPIDNKLGITDPNHINEFEAEGLIRAELFTFDLDEDVEINAQLILEIHHIGFGKLYEWGGRWRNIDVKVGKIHPPEPSRIPMLMYQFLDNLDFKVNSAKTFDDKVDAIAYAHHEYIKIHPFNNGNGRTGRLLMNLICLKFGYKPLTMYHKEGESRRIYIDALQAADHGDFSQLKGLIKEELELL
jgi:cell filamentation protein